MITADALVATAATALAGALPLPAPAVPGTPVPVATLRGSTGQLPAAPGAAVVARVGTGPGSQVTGQVAVVVAADLVDALAQSPLGQLDLAAAVQPALDACAAAVGSSADPGQRLDVDVALDGMLAGPTAVAVPLVDAAGTVVATAVLLLQPVGQDAGFVPSGVGGMVPPQRAATGTEGRGGLELLRDVAMEVTVELGRTRMTVRELLSLSPGAVIELDRAAGSPADLLVNGTMIARGEIVVVDEEFGIRITAIVTPGAEDSGAKGAGRA